MPDSPPVDLLSLPPDPLERELSDYFREVDEPPYRVDQVKRWIFERRVCEWGAMTDLSKAVRTGLGERFRLADPVAATTRVSRDGTVKHLWRLVDDQVVESVLIPTERRLTLCVSSQA